ncbi:unnamed protein product [Spirodela intermedia]|uniref:Uncharacterized protein n=1 Tax=Spirodela intermedia TaxID=51605 RepID=A0A7I8IK63_SPIIN|nr:unnamed protein product [Spirodela intermedia]CAA6658278.1 unnamed protein product [Spirodela intermedia]
MASSSSTLSRLFRCSRARHANRSVAAVGSRKPRPVPSPNPMRRPDQGVEEVVGDLFNERDLHRLVSRFKEASACRRFRSKHRVYEVAVQRLAAAGRHDGVEEILEDQKRYGEDIAREGFAARVIGLYGKAGMAAAAEETFRQLPSLGCCRTALSFNALLSACSAAADPERIDELFRSIPAECPGIAPDKVSYNILIKSMCRRSDLDGAMCLLEMMEERGAEPNLITFNTLLDGFYSHGRFSDAEKIWELMAQKKSEGLVLGSRTTEAAEIVERLPGMGLRPDTFTFNSLIKGHCEAGNLDDARKVFENLTKNGCRPNRETFETMVPRLCQAGELDLALSMCKESISRKCCVTAEILQEVADSLSACSRADDAEKLVKLSWLKNYDEMSVRMPSPSAAAAVATPESA